MSGSDSGQPLPEPVQRIQAKSVFAQIYSADSHENLLFSPVSAEIILALLLNGVKGGAEKAIRNLLNLDDSDAEILMLRLAADLKTMREYLQHTELMVASAFWYQEGRLRLRPALAQMFQDALGVDICAEDFHPGKGAQGRFNNWVSRSTKEKILELTFPTRPPWVPPDQPYPLFIGANALYLKANWCHPFSSYPLGTDFFHCSDGSEQEMTFMEYSSMHGDSGISYLQGSGYHAVQIPFEDEQLVMEVYLPYAEHGLGTTMQNLDRQASAGEEPQFHKRNRVYILMPVFEIESRLTFSYGNLGKQLAALFRPGRDFDEMFVKDMEDEMLGLADVVQATWLRVDETGVEAAAVSAFFGGGVGSANSEKDEELVVFEADHPFLYQIRHLESDRVLFMGTLVKPGVQADPRAIRGDLEWKERYDERYRAMGMAGSIALQASLLYAWSERQPMEAAGFQELLSAVWKWVHSYHEKGSFEEYAEWLKEMDIDFNRYPLPWSLLVRQKDGSFTNEPFPPWVQDACYVFSVEGINRYAMGWITKREFLRFPLISASKEIIGEWPELERFELFDRNDEAARKKRPELGEFSAAYQKIALREITEQGRRERKAYRYGIRVQDRLVRMEREELIDWAKETYQNILAHLDLKSGLWNDLSESKLWEPFFQHSPEGMNRGNWNKETANEIRDGLQKVGRTPQQALDLVRQAVRFPILLVLAQAVVEQEVGYLNAWVNALVPSALEIEFDLL